MLGKISLTVPLIFKSYHATNLIVRHCAAPTLSGTSHSPLTLCSSSPLHTDINSSTPLCSGIVQHSRLPSLVCHCLPRERNQSGSGITPSASGLSLRALSAPNWADSLVHDYTRWETATRCQLWKEEIWLTAKSIFRDIFALRVATSGTVLHFALGLMNIPPNVDRGAC